MPQVRIAVRSDDGATTTSTWVVWALNHLNQKRQFAFDGRVWYYQPTTSSLFQRVNSMDLPEAVWHVMSAHTGKLVSELKEVSR
jgi:hypothetical protein